MMWAGVVGQGALTVHYCRLRILAWTDMRCDIGFRSHHWFFKHKSTFVTDIEGSKVCACPCFVLSRYVFVVHVHTLVSHTWVALSQIVCRHVYTSSLWAQLHSIWFLMHPHLLRCHDAKDTNSIWVAVWANARCREFQGAVIPSIASCLCVFLWVKWTRVKVKNRHVKPKLTVVFFLAFWLATRTRHLLVWSNILFVSLIFSFSWRVSALPHDQMDGYQVENPCGICPASLYSFWDRPSLVSSARVLRKNVCDDAMLHATALCLSLLAAWTSMRTCIVERTFDEEIHKRINHLLRIRMCVQMERSEDAIRIECVCSEDDGFLHKQLENQNSVGELLWRACTGSLGEKLDEPWNADYVVEHIPSKIDCDDSEGTSRATQRKWSTAFSWKRLHDLYHKSLLNTIRSWKKEKFWDDVNGGYLP